jgi:hypothetical protein
MKRFGLVLCGLGVGLLAAAAPAQAALITGNLGVSGDFVYDNLVLTTGNPGDAGLDFETTASLPPPPEQDTEGVLVITGGSGYFQSVGVVAGTTARIANITNVNPPTDGNYAYLENGVDLTLTPFENFLSTFSAETGLSFNVTEFVNQSGPGCPAVPTCAEGPFSSLRATRALTSPSTSSASSTTPRALWETHPTTIPASTRAIS